MNPCLADIHRLFGWRYRVVRELGGGGTAAVFLADDLLSGTAVALKASPDAAALRREYAALHRHRHPVLIAARDLYVSPEMAVLATEHFPGTAVGSPPLPVERVLQVWSRLADALSHLHRRGIVHGDIKPEHVLVAGDEVRLIDLGLAGRPGGTVGPEFQGTVACAAPELLSGVSGATMRSDIYGLGLVVWAALGLRPPSPGERLDPDDAWLAAVGTSLPPAAAEELCRMLRFAPERRHAAGADLVAALGAADAYRPGVRRTDLPFAGRGRALRAAIAAAGSGGGPIVSLSCRPGDGASRFLAELHFLLQVTGKHSIIASAPVLPGFDWAAVPDDAVVLADLADPGEVRMVRTSLPAGARVVSAAAVTGTGQHSAPAVTIDLAPLSRDDLHRALRSFIVGCHPRDAAALARHLAALSAGNIGTAAAWFDRLLAAGLIEPSHGRWRFDWPGILSDRGETPEIERELTRLWDGAAGGERRIVERCCVTGWADEADAVRLARWRRYLGGPGGGPRAVAWCARRFICGRIAAADLAALLGAEPAGDAPAPDPIRWELLARAGRLDEWAALGSALFAAACSDGDGDAALVYGSALADAGQAAADGPSPISLELFRLAARMGRAELAARCSDRMLARDRVPWEPALAAARFFAAIGDAARAGGWLGTAAAAAPPHDAAAARRLASCRAWIGSVGQGTDGFPPELLEIAAGNDAAAADANEYLARIAAQRRDWPAVAAHAEAAARGYGGGDRPALGSALLLLGHGLWNLGQPEGAERALRRCLELLDDGLPDVALAGAWEHLALAMIARRQWDDAEHCLAMALQELPRPAPPGDLAYLTAMRGVVQGGRGCHALVRDSQAEAAALYLEAGDGVNYAICLANAAMEQQLLGNRPAADAMLRRALRSCAADGAAAAEPIVLKDLCRAALDDDRPADAWEWFQRGRRLARDRGTALPAEFTAAGALAAALLGDAGGARELAGQMAAAGEGADGCWRDLAEGERLVRGGDGAGTALLHDAGDRFLSLGMELEAAGCWARAAAAVLACDPEADPGPVVARLLRAESVYRRHGARPALDRVRMLVPELLRRAGDGELPHAADPGLLSGLFELTDRLASATDPEAIADSALRMAVRLLGAERGGLFLLGQDSELILVAQVNLDPDTRRDALDFSRQAVLAAAGSGREVYSNDAQLDEQFGSRLSVKRNAIRSLLAAPVSYREGAIGALYLDTRLKGGVFSPRRREFLRALAAIIGSVLESGRLVARLQRENRSLRDGREAVLDRIVGASPAVRDLMARVRTAAAVDVRVLMEGETGTGKELAARAIHELSGRSGRTFLALDCGSLPENLLEAELFGSVKGAFTGAYADKKGLFEAADGGTLFLDEITSASMGVQARLLRAIEAGEVRRVGDTAVRRVDVRLICATNRDPEVEINEGRFREDLYYRLNVVRLRVPPLRERSGDILLLAEHYRRLFQRQYRRRGTRFSDAARECLLQYAWPGNIRELEHVVKRAVIMSAGPVITPSDLEIRCDTVPPATIREETDQARRARLVDALRATNGNVSRASAQLGISRRQVQRLMRKYEINNDGESSGISGED
ncbi:MAG: sigma 54-interacting transcriptional regulator [Candidatus Edwardsbacteria bacterium]|nr:sigma 54-interacting transcriptional regulator [Candidatus Edwardsbacteria bacterium]